MIGEALARLSAETAVRYAPHVGLAFTTDEPPDDDVARAHVVAVTSTGDVVVCRSVEEWRFLPGGTREPGETVADLVRRELREEVVEVLTLPPAEAAGWLAVHDPVRADVVWLAVARGLL